MEKLEWLGYPKVKKISKISLVVLAQLTNVTDGQRRTDGHRMPAITALAMHSIARQNDIRVQLSLSIHLYLLYLFLNSCDRNANDAF